MTYCEDCGHRIHPDLVFCECMPWECEGCQGSFKKCELSRKSQNTELLCEECMTAEEAITREDAIHCLRMAFVTGRDAARKPGILRALMDMGDSLWVLRATR